MAFKNFTGSKTFLAGIGLGAGVVIAAIDNFAFKGEVSPFMIVAMLVAVAAASGVFWNWRGWIVTVFAWVCVPFAHLIKHVLGLPDTLHPNTYSSILMLALFTLVVSTVGLVGGVFFRRLTKVGTKSNS
jgi:hypothetical protein